MLQLRDWLWFWFLTGVILSLALNLSLLGVGYLSSSDIMKLGIQTVTFFGGLQGAWLLWTIGARTVRGFVSNPDSALRNRGKK